MKLRLKKAISMENKYRCKINSPDETVAETTFKIDLPTHQKGWGWWWNTSPAVAAPYSMSTQSIILSDDAYPISDPLNQSHPQKNFFPNMNQLQQNLFT
jgi:hypothetical protein